MEEIGVVKSVEGLTAKVAVAKKSMCDKCTAGTCLLTDEGAEIEALNNIGAEVGQRVRVALKPYSYIKGSLVVYGLPAASLVVGAVLGKEYFSRHMKGMDPDLVSAIFGFGAFIVSFALVKLWSMRAEKKMEYKPVIEEILKGQ
ncbi:MAG: SoxR reducing system RseC family protein [Thermodesulfovibrionales bacterium]|nr:SoxR reducing system RseC family protein [Thermodesulfovibrionales bacterium]